MAWVRHWLQLGRADVSKEYMVGQVMILKTPLVPGISVLYGDANLGKSLGKPTLLSAFFFAARSQEIPCLQGREDLVIEHTVVFLFLNHFVHFCLALA